MKSRRMLFSVLMLATSFTSPHRAGAQVFDNSWQTIDSGGGESVGGAFVLEGTIGQPDAGFMSGGEFELVGGFWAVATAGTLIPGDCDGDGDVDLTDYVGFEACLNGPGGAPPPTCACFDLDADGDTDLFDFAEFQVAFTE